MIRNGFISVCTGELNHIGCTTIILCMKENSCSQMKEGILKKKMVAILADLISRSPIWWNAPFDLHSDLKKKSKIGSAQLEYLMKILSSVED